MAAFGSLFPTPKISEEKGEPGAGEPPFQLGRIDLENNTVEVVRPDDHDVQATSNRSNTQSSSGS